MVFWTLITIIFSVAFFDNSALSLLAFTTQEALSYFGNLFQALSFVFLLCIAKHASWTKAAVPQQLQQQQQYVHSHHDNSVNGQQNYQQQPPVYNGTNSTFNGKGK